jgi:membrane-associated phospholipid phosphatase
MNSIPLPDMKKLGFPKAFLITSFVVCLALLIVILSFDKKGSFLLLQTSHTVVSDSLMAMLTNIAHGSFILIIVVLLTVVKKARLSIILLVGFALSGIIVQTIKNTIYKNEPRPVQWFANQNYELEVPENLSPHMKNSFPSGHSASAASLFAFLAFRLRKSSTQVVLAIAMFTVAYTRIYLFEHFPFDVLIGVCIGLFTQIGVELYYKDKLQGERLLKLFPSK